jgi:PiT family inorganic phosphate transporter
MNPAPILAAETATATVILVSSHLGYALSTTQVASGAVVGSGVGGRVAGGVHWNVVGQMVLAWLLTLPAAGVLGAAAGSLAEAGTAGEILVAVIGVAVATAIWFRSRRNPVTAENVNVEDAIVPTPPTSTPVG